MPYERISAIVSRITPKDKKPLLTEVQVEHLKTAGAVILCMVGVAGAIALSAIAPNAFVAIDKVFGRKHGKLSKKDRDRKIAQTFYYMKRSGFIRMKLTKGDFKLFLTRLGKKRFMKLQFQTMRVPTEKHWTKTWWQVAADIPTEKYKAGADMFREKVKSMFFYPLQRTLWFYPFDPRSEIEFIASHYNIGRFVTVMEVKRLDKDDEDKMAKFFRKKGIL